MYRLIYKTTEGLQGEQDIKEYSVWLEGEPTQADKDHFISQLEAQGKLPERDLSKSHTKSYETYQQTVMVKNEDKEDLEIVYQRKEAKDITFYSDGTYVVDEGTSHNYNDNYFVFEGPYSEKKIELDKDVEIAKIHAEANEAVAKINAESNEKIARINE